MRAQNKVRRILMLIDVLAPLRMPFTIQDAMDCLAERSGSSVDVCKKTIQRDLELLESMNFAYVHRAPKRGSKLPGQYKMNLRMTTNVETAALKASDRGRT